MNDLVTCARRGWAIFLVAPGPFLMAGLVWTLINLPLQWLLIGPALFSLFTMGLKAWRGETPDQGDILSGFRDAGTTLIAGFLLLAPFAAWSALDDMSRASQAALEAVASLETRPVQVLFEPPAQQPLPAELADDPAPDADDAESLGVVRTEANAAAPRRILPPRAPVLIQASVPGLPPDVVAALAEAPRPGVPFAVSLLVLAHAAFLLFLFAVLADRKCGLVDALRTCVALAEAPAATAGALSSIARQFLFGVPLVLVVAVLGMLPLPYLKVPFLLIGAVPLAACFVTAWYVDRAHPVEASLRDGGGGTAQPSPPSEGEAAVESAVDEATR